MSKTGTNFWLGLIIGLLAALLVSALAVLLVPRLRPIISTPRPEESQNNIVRPVIKGDVDNSSSVNGSAANSINNKEENNNAAASKIKGQLAENIKVSKPQNGDAVLSPLIVKGEARVFESNVSLRVRDGDGAVLASTSTTATGADIGEFSSFSLSLVFSPPKYDYGSLEAFEISAKDGSEINKVIVPLNFK